MPLNYPRIWENQLGENADISDLPETTSGTSGLASISALFPPITQIPLKAGGVAPNREDFNALFKLLGDNIYFQQNGGTYVYSATQNYYVGAVVWHNSRQYVALLDNGPAFSVGPKSPTDTAYWQEVIAPQLAPYSDNETLISRILDKIGATSNTPAGTLTVAQVKTALESTLAGMSSAAFLSKANVFNSSQTCTAALPATNFENILVTYAQAVAIAKSLSSVPVGTVLAIAGINIPDGWLLCNGAEVSRTQFANLFAETGTRWGSGDGSTTFNLPNYDGRHVQGTIDVDQVGVYLPAGLPNITGDLVPYDAVVGLTRSSGIFSGAFKQGNRNLPNALQNVSSSSSSLGFDASLSNALYGKSSVVQTASNQNLIIIKF